MTDPGTPGKGYTYDNHTENSLSELLDWVKNNVKPGHVEWIAVDKSKWHVLHLKEKEV